MGFSVGFDPTIDGKRLTFAEVGLLGGVFRMQDHQTGTIWTHLDGKAIAGPLVGHRLKMVPTPHAPGHLGRVEVREHGNGDGTAP